MRLAAVVSALGVAATVAACGGDARGPVRAKVEQFARAARAHDYGTICRDVLAPALLADIDRAGLGCRQALGIALGHVTAPRLVIGNVLVRGGTASVLTLSQAQGQRAVVTTLRLVQTRDGWRISSLGSPVG